MKKRGVTLFEICAAIGIMAIVLLSIILAFTNGMKLLSANSQITTATEIGRSFLERVKKQGSSNLVPGTYDARRGDLADAATGFPPPPYPRPVDNSSYFLVVEATPLYAPVGTVKVKVDVFWSEKSAVSLQTYLLQ